MVEETTTVRVFKKDRPKLGPHPQKKLRDILVKGRPEDRARIKELEAQKTPQKKTSEPLDEPYEPIHECKYYSEYPSKPAYIKCRKEHYWKILKRKECEACSRYRCMDITGESRKYEKIKQMTSMEQHHLAELQSERTRLNEKMRLLKEKTQPKIVERVVERIVEVPTVDEGTRQGIKQLETDLKYWKEEAQANAEKMGPLLKELEIAQKHQTMFICPKKNWIPYEYCKKECPELIDCPWFSMVRENFPIKETQ